MQLTYFHDGPDVILLASNYGGTKHPQWYYNLKAHPECEFGGQRLYRRQRSPIPTNTHGSFGLAEQIYAGLRRLPRQDLSRRPPDPDVPTQTALVALPFRKVRVGIAVGANTFGHWIVSFDE